MNYLEYGQVIYFNADEDISANTNTLILEPQEGTAKEVSATIGGTDITVNGATYTANEYVSYTVVPKDIDYPGFWRVKLKSKYSSTKELQTDYKKFVVRD